MTMRRSYDTYNRPLIMRASHAGLDFLFIVLMLILLLIAIYMELDLTSVYQEADPKQWVQYKPDFPEEVETFEELQEKNSDVIGWLTIYDTNIDYPLLFPSDGDNNYYLAHDPVKKYTTSGSLYLDARNTRDFSDFNNIIHGHHMAQHKMFGDLDMFVDEEYFLKHEYGNLYANGKDYGFQIVAVVMTDGYDWSIYRLNVDTPEKRVEYINALYESAVLVRGIDLKNMDQAERTRKLLTQGITSPITPNDHLLVFSTCNLKETNGRYIVVAKLLDHTVANPFPKSEIKPRNPGSIDVYSLFNQYGALPIYIWIGIILLLILLMFIFYRLSRRRDRKIAERKAKAPEGDDAYDQNE